MDGDTLFMDTMDGDTPSSMEDIIITFTIPTTEIPTTDTHLLEVEVTPIITTTQELR